MRFSKPPSPTWRGFVEEEPRPTAWDGARRALTREDNHAKSTSARVHRGRLAGSLRGEARAGRAPRESKKVATTFRSRSRRPGEVLTKKSLGQGRGTERVARWPRRQPCQVSQRTRAPWAVGRYPWVEACAGCAQWGQTICYDISKPLLPTWRDVGEEEPRPTEWGGLRCALAAKTTTTSPPASACFVGGWLAFHEAIARGPCATGVKYGGQYVSKPQPSTLRGVGVGGTLANVRGGARRALAAKTTTPSQPAHTWAVGLFSRGEAHEFRVPRGSSK